MIRRLFTITSAISLILCVATIWLWLFTVTKEWSAESVRVDPPKLAYIRYIAELGGGGIKISRLIAKYDPSRSDAASFAAKLPRIAKFISKRGAEGHYPSADGSGPERGPLGFSIWSYRMPLFPPQFLKAQNSGAVIPGWFLPFLSAVCPSLWVWQNIHLKRLNRHGHCRRCDYDLRASEDRCPECGTPIDRGVSAPI